MIIELKFSDSEVQQATALLQKVLNPQSTGIGGDLKQLLTKLYDQLQKAKSPPGSLYRKVALVPAEPDDDLDRF